MDAIVQHYLQLLLYYRRWVISTVVLAAVFAAVMSMVRLASSPVFTATASVALLPTEAELTFGRETASGGARGTVRGLTATYIEYLKSRPVVESAFARIENAGLAVKPPVSESPLIALIRRAKGVARRTFRLLDSGRFVPSDAREKALQNLVSAISLKKVTDSYIMRIEVGLRNPETAATVANALAEAYVERITQQLETSAGQMEEFLHEQVRLREDSLQQLVGREEALKRDLGLVSLAEERQYLIQTRELERQRLVDAQIEMQTATADLRILEQVNLAHSGRSLAEVNEARAAATARGDAATRNLALRTRAIAELSASLDELNAKQEPLVVLQRQRLLMEGELAELNTRLLSTNLARSAAMTQVRVIDPARPPVYPSSPRVVVNTAAAIFASLLAALFGIVALDTISGMVKTTPDLARLVGSRSLGLLDRRSVADATARGAGQTRRLKRLGALLERRLVLLGGFEAPVIQITGFAESKALRQAAITVGAALASLGRTVVCRLPPENPTALPTGPAMDGRLHVAEEWGSTDASAIRVDCIGPVSSELSLSETANRSAALVCVLPLARVSESLVEDFLEKSLAAGLSAVSFVLLER